MKYDVLATPDLEELQGGIATMVHPPRYTVFYQAIVKPNK